MSVGRVTTDEDDEQLRQKELRLLRAEQTEDLKAVLSTPQGLRVIRRMIIEGQPFARGVAGNSKDYFRAGQRDFALWLINDIIEYCPQFLTRVARLPKELRATPEAPSEE